MLQRTELTMKPLIKLIVTLLLEVSKVWNFNFMKKKFREKKRKSFPREIQNSIDNVTMKPLIKMGGITISRKKSFSFFVFTFFEIANNKLNI